MQGLHRIRYQYDKTRKQRINLVHGLLAEFGLSLPKAITRFASMLGQQSEQLPETLRQALLPVIEEIAELEQRLRRIESQLAAIGKHDPIVQRLMTMPGVGLIIATAMAASVPNIHTFQHRRSGTRQQDGSRHLVPLDARRGIPTTIGDQTTEKRQH